MRFALFFVLPLVVLCCALGWALAAYPVATLTALALYQVHCVVSPSSVLGKRWAYFSERGVIANALRREVGLQLHLPDSLAPSAPVFTKHKQAILAFHPHGVMSDFRLLVDGLLPGAFPRLSQFRALSASVLFHIPLVREVALWTGCVHASRPVAKKVLGRGLSVVVIPGGEKEQLLTEFGKDKVWLRHRKGFVRLAIEHGVPLVPAFVFGCTDMYHTSLRGLGLRSWLVDNLRVCLPLFWGRAGLPLPLPGAKLDVVFGDPLVFAPGESVDAAHAKYIAELTTLYDKHKARFGCAHRTLIVE